MARLLNSGLSAHRTRTFKRSSNDVSVPEGMTKVDELLDWVGGDTSRARAVLDSENEKPEKHRRKTLVQQLAELIVEA